MTQFRYLKVIFLLFSVFGFSHQALAQRLPSIAPPQSSPLILPPFTDPNLSAPLQLEIPNLSVPEIQGNQQLTLKKINFIGNHALSTHDLDQVFVDYLGRTLNIQEILKFREIVSKIYLARGYSLSSAIISLDDNQRLDPDNAVITIRCIEGTVDRISFLGKTTLEGFIRHQLQPAIQPALNEPRLITALVQLRTNPAIRNIQARIDSLGEVGHYTLTLTVTPEVPFGAVLSSANDGTVTTGTLSQSATLFALSPLDWGDSLQVGYRRTEGSDAWSTLFNIPVTASGGSFSFSFNNINSRIIPPPFNILDIRSSEQIYTLAFRQPIFSSFKEYHQREFNLGLGITHTTNQGELLGFPFPIIQGADNNGLAQTTVLSLSEEFMDRTPYQAFVSHMDLKFGLPIAATLTPNSPNGNFVAWTGNISYQRRLRKSLALNIHSAFQLVNRPVFSFEQFNLTGIDAVRGYPQNSLIQDNGWVLNTELSGRLYSGKAGELSLSPFFDLGVPWSAGRTQIVPSSDPNLLASVGLELQYHFQHYLSLDLTWGVPLYPVKTFGSTLQEQGLSFSIKSKLP